MTVMGLLVYNGPSFNKYRRMKMNVVNTYILVLATGGAIGLPYVAYTLYRETDVIMMVLLTALLALLCMFVSIVILFV